MSKTDHERIESAMQAIGRNVPWITAGGRVLVNLFPSRWNAGDVGPFLKGLADKEREAVLYGRLKPVAGNPLDALRLATTPDRDTGAGTVTAEHIEAAKDWPEAIECLRWACEAGATVKEMAAWRRAAFGK